jgi:cobalamin biosynthesis Mg chelatase CobN
MRNKGRFLVLLTLFVGFSLGIFFSMATSAAALPEYASDGKTCTPCHEPGEHDGGGAGEGTGISTEGEQKPTEQQPAQQGSALETQQSAEQPAEVKEVASSNNVAISPYLVIGLVVVVLGVIYILASKKR